MKVFVILMVCMGMFAQEGVMPPMPEPPGPQMPFWADESFKSVVPYNRTFVAGENTLSLTWNGPLRDVSVRIWETVKTPDGELPIRELVLSVERTEARKFIIHCDQDYESVMVVLYSQFEWVHIRDL